MIPFGDKTVTLLHRTESGYARHVLAGCSWRMANVRALDGTTMRRTLETTCRIPAGQVMPAPGDLLVLGAANLQAGNEIELVRLLESLRGGGRAAFRVLRVKDNAQGAPLPHYAAIGE